MSAVACNTRLVGQRATANVPQPRSFQEGFKKVSVHDRTARARHAQANRESSQRSEKVNDAVPPQAIRSHRSTASPPLCS